MCYLRSGWVGLAALALTAAAFAGGVTASPALADSGVTVTTTSTETTAGDGLCSLREAILYAEGKNGSNTDCGTKATGTTTINLPGGLYAFSNWDAPLEIGPGGPGPIVLNGGVSGTGETVIDPQRFHRVLTVDAGVTVTLRNLTLRGGGGLVVSGGDYRDGGGIYNAGALELDHVLVTGNQTDPGNTAWEAPGNGGGIYNTGTLTVFASTISGNSTGDGVTPASSPGTCVLAGGSGEPGGDGAGLYNQAGTVRVIDSMFTGNVTGNGGTGQNGSSPSGSCAGGGNGGNGGHGGGGGAIFNNDGTLTISGSTINGNATGTGGAGGTGGDSPVTGGFGGEGGEGGEGGGIANNGLLTVINTTITGNGTGNGAQGGQGGNYYRHGLDGPDGLGGPAGAIYHQNGQATVQETTIAWNTAGHGAGFEFYTYATSGIVVVSGELTEINTINSHNDCYTWPTGQLKDGITAGDGHLNLSWAAASCPGLGSDPMLGPLQDNGGPTQTMAIAPPSLAIGRIPPTTAAGCTLTDQRGFLRPAAKIGRCDVGSFEYQP